MFYHQSYDETATEKLDYEVKGILASFQIRHGLYQIDLQIENKYPVIWIHLGHHPISLY